MRERLTARQAAERAEALAGACAPAGARRASLQCFPQNAQEALDMRLVGLRLAADPRVGLPSTLAVDDVARACEVDVPSPEQAREFLTGVPAASGGRERPTAGLQAACEAHKAMARALNAIDEAEEALERAFGRSYPGTLEEYRCEDADYVAVALGGVAWKLREQVDRARKQGMAVGLLRVRYLRPFDAKMLALSLAHARAVGVVEAQVEPGAEGPLFSLVNSALYQHGVHVPTTDFICDAREGASPAQALGIFKALAYTASFAADKVQFLGAGSLADALGADTAAERGQAGR